VLTTLSRRSGIGSLLRGGRRRLARAERYPRRATPAGGPQPLRGRGAFAGGRPQFPWKLKRCLHAGLVPVETLGGPSNYLSSRRRSPSDISHDRRTSIRLSGSGVAAVPPRYQYRFAAGCTIHAHGIRCRTQRPRAMTDPPDASDEPAELPIEDSIDLHGFQPPRWSTGRAVRVRPAGRAMRPCRC
jgi:hypothetical protein